MALPRITQKEMTEREQRELKTLLDRARIAHVMRRAINALYLVR